MNPQQRLPEDVRAYARQTLGWSEITIDKVEAEFYLTRTMNWSQASWEEIRGEFRAAIVKAERARVRKRLLWTIRRIAFKTRDGSPGGCEAVVVLQSELLAALDRIIPEEG